MVFAVSNGEYCNQAACEGIPPLYSGVPHISTCHCIQVALVHFVDRETQWDTSIFILLSL